VAGRLQPPSFLTCDRFAENSAPLRLPQVRNDSVMLAIYRRIVALPYKFPFESVWSSSAIFAMFSYRVCLCASKTLSSIGVKIATSLSSILRRHEFRHRNWKYRFSDHEKNGIETKKQPLLAEAGDTRRGDQKRPQKNRLDGFFRADRRPSLAMESYDALKRHKIRRSPFIFFCQFEPPQAAFRSLY